MPRVVPKRTAAGEVKGEPCLGGEQARAGWLGRGRACASIEGPLGLFRSVHSLAPVGEASEEARAEGERAGGSAPECRGPPCLIRGHYDPQSEMTFCSDSKVMVWLACTVGFEDMPDSQYIQTVYQLQGVTAGLKSCALQGSLTAGLASFPSPGGCNQGTQEVTFPSRGARALFPDPPSASLPGTVWTKAICSVFLELTCRLTRHNQGRALCVEENFMKCEAMVMTSILNVTIGLPLGEGLSEDCLDWVSQSFWDFC